MHLSDIELFMIDMDGTFYLEDELLPGAADFLAACKKNKIKYTFLTNNSSKTSADYIAKLARMGVRISEDEMFTSGDATLLYLKEENCAKDILLVGTNSLHEQFAKAGYITESVNPKTVVLGFDTTITYAKLTALCNAVRARLPYIATHPDYNCPVNGGYIPDIGAVIAFVKAATGREPDTIVGKPNPLIAQMAAKRAGVALNKVCMIGDRLYTDIALGKTGVQTALVFSGEATPEDLAESGLTPTFVFQNLAEMARNLEERENT